MSVAPFQPVFPLPFDSDVPRQNMDLPRFSAAPIIHLSGYPFECQGTFPTQCRVLPARFIKAINASEDSRFSSTARMPV